MDVVEKPSSKRASSFRGLRFSNIPGWSALNSAPPIMGANVGDEAASADNDAPRRVSPTQRLSTWLNSKLATRKDPQEDRLWNKDQPDIEAPQTPGENVVDDDQSPIQAKYFDKPLTATWQDPYSDTQNPTNASTIDTQSSFSSANNGTTLTTPISAPPKAVISTSPGTTSTLAVPPIGKMVGQFEVRRSYESRSDSPVYGINGIVERTKRENSPRSWRPTYVDNNESDAIYQLEKEKAELERSMASMAAFSPSRTSFATDAKGTGLAQARSAESGAQTATSIMSPPSESFKSDISLRDFPSPPGASYRSSPMQIPNPANTIRGVKEAPKKAGEGITDRAVGAMEIVEDVQFAMVPPRMPAAFQRRRASFPSVVRESGFSSMDGMSRIISTYAESEDDIGGKRVRMSGSYNRLDVTSFIGGELPILQRLPCQ